MNKSESESTRMMTSVHESLYLMPGTALSTLAGLNPQHTLDGRTETTHFTYKETEGPAKLRNVPLVTQRGLNSAVASGVRALSHYFLPMDQFESLHGGTWHVTIYHP